MTKLDDLQKSSFDVADSKGFHEAQLNLPPETLVLYLRLMLTVGELAEAAEELRKGHKPTDVYYEYDLTGHPLGIMISDSPFLARTGQGTITRLGSEKELEVWTTKYPQDVIFVGKPEGFGIELADALIRLADLAESTGVLLSEAAEIKERYNRTRAHLHGKTA